MDVRAGFTPFENQGPFLEHIGPVYVREGEQELVLGLRADDRHAEREIVRARAVWIVAG